MDISTNREQLDGLVRSLLGQVRGITRQDAEDAVQEAWIVLAEKADQLEPGPIGGYLLRTARFKALHIRDKRRKTTSLEAMVDVAGEATIALADKGDPSIESVADLDGLADDPIASRALDAAKKGAAAQVAPRGLKHRCGRYTDDQVDAVRRLRIQGFVYREIQDLTGVPAGYCASLVRRASRVTESTEGWARELVIGALQRFQEKSGRAPRLREAEGNPCMPSPNTVVRMFGSWQAGVESAGLNPAYGDRRVRPWSKEEMVQAFCSWRFRSDRWPCRADMVSDPELPSPATTRRHFGTQSPERLSKAVLDLLT